MALRSGEITPEMIESMVEAKAREYLYWDRHGITDEKDTSETGRATEAHRAWVRAVEHEYNLMGKDKRVHLDTPIARLAFILGYRKAKVS